MSKTIITIDSEESAVGADVRLKVAPTPPPRRIDEGVIVAHTISASKIIDRR